MTKPQGMIFLIFQMRKQNSRDVKEQVQGHTGCLLSWGPGQIRLFFLFLGRAAYGILVSQPGVEPACSSVKARSPNHWNARELPPRLSFIRSVSIEIFVASGSTLIPVSVLISSKKYS